MAPQIKQGIRGKVIDKATGEAIIEAQVVVVGRPQKTLTDLDGNFAIDLPPGKYTLRSFYELYEPQRLENIEVKAGQTTEVGIELAIPSDADVPVEQMVITARADRATDATQLQIRKETASVRDAISAQEITRSGSNNAADAIRRVVSATIDPQNRLIVRGLGTRYNRVLLQGFRIPSTDPDDPGVELDLFPAGVLSNLAVLKTFTPDVPGDFAGGIMQIETRDFPQDFMLQANASIGYNTQATFRDTLDYDGGKRDWLGWDDGTRELPGAVPSDRIESRRTIENPNPKYTAEEVAEIGRSFDNTWKISSAKGMPNGSVGAVAGDTVRLGKRDLGYLAAFGFQNRTQHTVHKMRDPIAQTDGEIDLDQIVAYRGERTRRIGQIGAIGTINYDLAEGHDLTLTNLYSHSGTAEGAFVRGISTENQYEYAQRRLRWFERELWFSQLRGQHRVSLLKGLTVDWNGSVARAERDEPDTRTIRYERQNSSLPLTWASGGTSALRFFSNYEEWTVGSQLDVALSIVEQLKLKLGGQTRHSYATFRARRFNFLPGTGVTPELQAANPEQIFAPENIGSIVVFSEATRPNDGYDAASGLFAGYGMLDASPFAWLRLVGGLRAEFYDQDLESNAPTGPASAVRGKREVDEQYLDAPQLLPSAAAIFTVAKEMYVRASYGKTVSRPLFRELAPFQYEDDIRNRVVSGNVALKSATIHNVDLRWEMFPTPNEVLAVTGFYKRFVNPIEPYLAASQTSFLNAESAQNLGFELEARLGLERLHEALSWFSAGMNFTYVKSEIELGKGTTNGDLVVTNTNDKRPLAGQSPYVANLSLGVSEPDSGSSLFAYYNVFGKRIDQTGANGYPDTYEQPFHSLDLIGNYNLDKHWAIRLNAKNLLFNTQRYKSGPVMREQFNPGTVITLGAGFNY